MFPAFLPGTEEGSSFVFADTLGFHAVGMVRDSDQEPKASVAILAKALGETGAAETAPTVGKRSASVLANEVVKYLECHNTSRLLHVHALRPGDGLTVARALGGVRARYRNAPLEESPDEETDDTAPAFVLELYPSAGQRGVTGRFLSEAREKRRSGAGVLAAEDLWMLESLSLPGGVTLPRLRWARRSYQNPNTPAHLAIAFDTFESQVGAETDHVSAQLRPLYSFGLISFFERDYSSTPSPTWQSRILPSGEGEKHPSDRVHSERLTRLQNVLLRLVAKHINAGYNIPVLVSFPDRLTVERRLLWSKERSCGSRGSVRPKSLASCGMPRAACPCRTCDGRTASARRHSSRGGTSTGARRCRMCDNCGSSRLNTPSSSGCMRTWRWSTRPSRMSCTDNCRAVREATAG